MAKLGPALSFIIPILFVKLCSEIPPFRLPLHSFDFRRTLVQNCPMTVNGGEIDQVNI